MENEYQCFGKHLIAYHYELMHCVPVNFQALLPLISHETSFYVKVMYTSTENVAESGNLTSLTTSNPLTACNKLKCLDILHSRL